MQSFAYSRVSPRSPRPTSSIRSTSIRSATSSNRSSISTGCTLQGGAAVHLGDQVRTGKIKVFTGKEVTADAVMASACLPKLFRRGRDRRRGLLGWRLHRQPGPLSLFEQRAPTNPPGPGQPDPTRGGPAHRGRDHRAGERDHLQRLAAARLRAIDFVNRLLAENRLDTRKYRPNRMHRIDASGRFGPMAPRPRWTRAGASSRNSAMPAAKHRARVLREHYADVGVRATFDLSAEFM